MNPDQHSELRLGRVLFPDLASKLDAALMKHAEPTSEVNAFETQLDSAATERFAGAGFGELVHTDGGSRLADAFELARAVVSWAADAGLELKLPEPETFEAAGCDLARLSGLLSEREDLVPVPAPYGLGAKGWAAMFEHVPGLPASPFGSASQGENESEVTGGTTGDHSEANAHSPLLLASEVAREFAILDDPSNAISHATSDPRESGVAQSGAVSAGRFTWTLRLIPATAAPPVLGLNFTNCGPHVTLPEMLMLQLMRTAGGLLPLDGGDGRSSFTWLAGQIGEGRLAARHVYDASERAIRITAREIGNQGPHLGARQPVT